MATNGVITTDFGFHEFGYSVILQNDGKILVAGLTDDGFLTSNSFIARYNNNGALDTSFSDEGKSVTVDGDSESRSVIVQADGKIIVVGSKMSSTDWDFSLIRYTADGIFDSTIITNINASSNKSYASTIQADGKILVAGSGWGPGKNATIDFALVRYNSDGTLDSSFSGDGKLTTDFGSSDEARSVTVQNDGKILVAGFSLNGSEHGFALARYNNNGTLDTSFDGDGKLVTHFGDSENPAVIVQIDGKIIVSGSNYNGTDYDFGLIRYNSDGSLDTSFNGNGTVVTDFASANDFGRAIALQTDGKILVAGKSYNDGKYNVALARYNGDGTLDSSFDNDGKVTTSIGSIEDGARSLTIQADGKILVAGASYNGNNYDVALIRYNSDGSLDSTFNGQQPSGITLDGTSAGNLLNGDIGNDTLNGNAGNDTLNGGDGNDQLNGGTGKDILMGDSGNDTLNGGAGNDKLTGGTGKDTFAFDTALAKTGIDTIIDFKPIDDTIQLENAIFTKLTTVGVLNAANFVISTASVDKNDFLIYNDTTGALLYDADGNGAHSAVQIALIGATTHPTLTSANFVVI